MKGLYILGNPHLDDNSIIKIGMSMRLSERLFDYDAIFSDNQYHYCYVTNALTKYHILFLEKRILDDTIQYRNKRFSTEYRNINETFTVDNYHNLIINTLELFKIDYELKIKPEFPKPKKIKSEPIDLSEELLNMNQNPFNISKREELQNEYLDKIISELDKNKRVLCVAPTGFGKTRIFYNLIGKKHYLRIIIFTPRRILNKQTISSKYSDYLEHNYKFIQFNGSSERCKSNIKKSMKEKKNVIIISCYQSAHSLMSFLEKHMIDIVIFDEAHFIQSWENKSDNHIKFYLESKKIKNRLFLSATPPENMIQNSELFGNHINKVKVYELINYGILCNIETITKSINNKNKYKSIYSIINKTFIKYNKKKGIIYVNTQKNAYELYKLCKEKEIEVYLYISNISNQINSDYDCDQELIDFETSEKPAIIITCKKIDYGYDNIWIDLICYADERQGDIDVRQTMGRGLRNDESIYPNKILHVILPIVISDQYDTESYRNVIAYLRFIVEEVGQDIIIVDGEFHISGNKQKLANNNYDGDDIEPELCKFLSTTYNKYEYFARFLRENGVHNETTYNKLHNANQWMPLFSKLKEKHNKFCFRDIHPLNKTYYWTKEECEKAKLRAYKLLKDRIGLDKLKKMNEHKKLIEIHKIDKRIPNVIMYYP
jgi:superfamily II DNA or RNA helicase